MQPDITFLAEAIADRPGPDSSSCRFGLDTYSRPAWQTIKTSVFLPYTSCPCPGVLAYLALDAVVCCCVFTIVT